MKNAVFDMNSPKKIDLIAQIIGGWKENEPERVVNKVKLINM